VVGFVVEAGWTLSTTGSLFSAEFGEPPVWLTWTEALYDPELL
jgi:hypothetical protein